MQLQAHHSNTYLQNKPIKSITHVSFKQLFTRIQLWGLAHPLLNPIDPFQGKRPLRSSQRLQATPQGFPWGWSPPRRWVNLLPPKSHVLFLGTSGPVVIELDTLFIADEPLQASGQKCLFSFSGLGSKGIPKGVQRHPKGGSKASQGPQSRPRSSKTSPKEAKELQKTPQEGSRGPKGDLKQTQV